MKTMVLAGSDRLTRADLRAAGTLPASVISAAQAIVDDVRERGDEAVRAYTLKFDGSCPDSFRVSDDAVASARAAVSSEFLAALEHAAAQIREFHEHELERERSWTYERANGVRLGVRVLPVSSAAIYVPGGRAQYPSTVLMDCIPAKVAGVERVIMLTPPQAGGSISPFTLAAASVAGVDEVYAVGGAQAIAAAAYGTASIPAVDVIVGPGNAYVAAAKRAVSGDVGIDMIAGPSEVCVVADAAADPRIVAADLMAQAEHDPMAACYLVTRDAGLVPQVLAAIDAFLEQSPRAEITRASLDDNGICVVCDSTEAVLDTVNLIAPEHLELHCEDAEELLGGVRAAGAIFVGPWSSEPLGDYVAGPNHTLPTGGTARFSNPLGVWDFVTRSTVSTYTPAGVLADARATETLAAAEGLWAHALSVRLRREALVAGGAPDA